MTIQSKIWSFYNLAAVGGASGLALIARSLVYMLFSRRRDLNAYSMVDASAMVFIVYAVACFLIAARDLSRRDRSFGRDIFMHSPVSWILLYTVMGVVSMLWSVNLQLTGFRAFECLSMTMLMVATVQNLFYRGDLKLVVKWTLLYVTVDIFLSIIRSLTFDISYLLQLSQFMATTFFYMALYQSGKKWWHCLIFAMSIFSMSTVAYIGMALGSISLFFTSSKYRVPVFIAALTLGSVIALIGPYKFVKDTVFFDKKTISIHETTGRDKLMDVALEALKDRPEGYGFFAGEPYLLYSKGLGAINGHNSLFSAAIGLGVPGVIVMVVFFLMMIRTTFSRYIPPEYRASLIGCFIVSFLHSMGNPGIGSRVYGGWIPTMFMTVLICGFYIYGKYYQEIQDTDDEE